MSNRLLPTQTAIRTEAIDLRDVNLELGEQARQSSAPSGEEAMTLRARRTFAGLSQEFHRDYLTPALKSANDWGHAVGANVVRNGRAAGTHLRQGSQLAWSDSVANLPVGHTVLAAIGQTLQQVVNCGGPTYLREVAFMHAYSSLSSSLTEKHPKAALALQAGVSVASIAAQVYLRQPRLDRVPSNSTVAVRGHFGLSSTQWEQLPQETRNELQTKHRRDSRNVTRNQVAAEVIYLGMGALGAAKGDGALVARVLATQLRNVIYAGSREFMQASLSMTGKRGNNPSYGVNDQNMETLAWVYAAMTASMGLVQDASTPTILPPGQTLSSPALEDEHHLPLHGPQLALSVQKLAATRAALNTLVSIMDNHLAKHFEMRQSHNGQTWRPSLPLQDYDRVLDQSVARLSWTSLASAANMAMGEIANQGVTPIWASILGNAASAAALGLAYRTVNQTFQAHASVRKEVAKTSQMTRADRRPDGSTPPMPIPDA